MMFSKKDLPPNLKILLHALQTIGMYPRIFSNWPQNFLGFASLLSLSNINLDLFAPDCAVKADFWAKYYVKMFLPAIIGIGAVITYKPARYLLVKCSRRNDSFDIDPRNKIISLSLALVTRLYTLLISSALDPFHCSQVSETVSVLANDPSTQCYGTRWYRNLPAVGIFVLLYCVAVPTFLAWKLFQYRNKLDTPEMKARFGVLYIHYRRNCYWWEILLMLKRAAVFMALEVTQDADKSQSKVFLSIAVILAFTSVHVVVDPFVVQRKNALTIV
jgi:hypothetical protein